MRKISLLKKTILQLILKSLYIYNYAYLTILINLVQILNSRGFLNLLFSSNLIFIILRNKLFGSECCLCVFDMEENSKFLEMFL